MEAEAKKKLLRYNSRFSLISSELFAGSVHKFNWCVDFLIWVSPLIFFPSFSFWQHSNVFVMISKELGSWWVISNGQNLYHKHILFSIKSKTFHILLSVYFFSISRILFKNYYYYRKESFVTMEDTIWIYLVQILKTLVLSGAKVEKISAKLWI